MLELASLMDEDDALSARLDSEDARFVSMQRQRLPYPPYYLRMTYETRRASSPATKGYNYM